MSTSPNKSKFLALVLRHDPARIGIDIDAEGWADIDQLLTQASAHGTPLSRDDLEHLAEHSTKIRFRISVDGKRIRATHGHSIEVDLRLVPLDPPETLYHGTAATNLPSIRAYGLMPGRRQHVHLSADPKSAQEIGKRHGPAVVIEVAAKEAQQAGHVFFKSQSEIWLSGFLPTRFLDIPPPNATTNRQLYLFACNFAERFGEAYRPIDGFLRSLWLFSREARDKTTVEPSQFAGWLERAFVDEPPPEDVAWITGAPVDAQLRESYPIDLSAYTFADWEATLRMLLSDVADLSNRGRVAAPQSELGVQAASGVTWCNLDPVAFCERGIRTTFGGWKAGDGTPDDLLPESAPDDVETPLDPFNWQQLVAFLRNGAST